jgi:GrpB-like predicted nucleotidyltransferase (UPF0157 family)/GNAT superfamily N-acetyltransferase
VHLPSIDPEMHSSTEISLDLASPDDAEVRALYAEFIREADGPLRIDLEAEIAAGPPRDLTPPDGVLLLAKVGDEPAGLGGVRYLDAEFAEVKSMFVSPAHRGIGLGRGLLAELEAIAQGRGCHSVRLDTSDYLREAIGLYRSAGYHEVPAYNDNTKANLWFEHSLIDEPIRIAPYDPRWPNLFERERLALTAAIGPWATGGIHHVGSTSVAGLDAKPVIDILVGVEDLETSRACFEPLAGLEYLYAPYLSEEMHWFCKPHPSRRTHHLHLVPTGSERFDDELSFRDRLRSHPDTAKEYDSLKRDLASRFQDDRESYTKAKRDFIRQTLKLR